MRISDWSSDVCSSDLPDGYAGPYRLMLRVEDGRLIFELSREDGTPLEAIILGLGRFRRPIRDYFAICDSYYQAIKTSTAQQIETVDLARRGLHNEADRKSTRLNSRHKCDTRMMYSDH